MYIYVFAWLYCACDTSQGLLFFFFALLLQMRKPEKTRRRWFHGRLKMRYKGYLQVDGAPYQRGAHSWENLWRGHLGLQDSGRGRGRRREFLQMGKNFNCHSKDGAPARFLQMMRNVQEGIQEW